MDFCDITTRKELAEFIGVKPSVLTYVLYSDKAGQFYKSFTIPKKNGSPRNIYAPINELKTIQKKLADALYSYQTKVREENNIKVNISHAFEKGKGIASNAIIHKNKRFIICFDLKDYFETFHIGRVIGFFENNKYFNLPHEVAATIAQIACYNGFLPQGAPTSPVITNLISQILDFHLLKVAKKYHLDYTRYADDLTFSTNSKHFLIDKDNFIADVEKTVSLSGFILNKDKTRLVYKDSQQKVTGLIVNKKINVPRKFYKDTRVMWHSLYTTGKFFIGTEEGTLRQLEGRFSFINQIENYNCERKTKQLSTKEREYRNFLFYKNFVINKKPIIVTEGKTDILYIKAALKNLYQEYPNLVEKNASGKFSFKISFFNRSKSISHMFDISPNGADAMAKLYSKIETDTSPDSINSFITKKKLNISENPIIFLFDNENDNNHPLGKFLNLFKSKKDSSEKYKKLCEDQYIRIGKKLNIYIATIPLKQGMSQCEIEDLFTQDTLKTEINGRYFSKTDEDPKRYYNKNIFSKYVYKKYTDIDFSGFKPLLDCINSIILKENG